MVCMVTSANGQRISPLSMAYGDCLWYNFALMFLKIWVIFFHIYIKLHHTLHLPTHQCVSKEDELQGKLNPLPSAWEQQGDQWCIPITCSCGQRGKENNQVSTVVENQQEDNCSRLCASDKKNSNDLSENHTNWQNLPRITQFTVFHSLWYEKG